MSSIELRYHFALEAAQNCLLKKLASKISKALPNALVIASTQHNFGLV